MKMVKDIKGVIQHSVGKITTWKILLHLKCILWGKGWLSMPKIGCMNLIVVNLLLILSDVFTQYMCHHPEDLVRTSFAIASTLATAWVNIAITFTCCTRSFMAFSSSSSPPFSAVGPQHEACHQNYSQVLICPYWDLQPIVVKALVVLVCVNFVNFIL